MTRIRTLDFLPQIFQTNTNSQFLGATLDQFVNPPITKKIDGFVGSKLGYGINANDYYVAEPSKDRVDYQLEPGVVFTKTNESIAKDFLSYVGFIDALKLQDSIVNNNERLFNSQFYSWDSFTNLDMLINYSQYYWLPQGPPAVTVNGSIEVESDILGETNYTSPNGIVFTNGLKIRFEGNIIPNIYLNNNEYYVQGVGTSIELININNLIVPESYTDATNIGYDTLPYDIGNYDSDLYLPITPDYITIARNSKNENPWARSNRWFHIQVIQDTSQYLENPEIIAIYANEKNKARRPILEFYPNLKLFNSGTVAMGPVDFIDTRTLDAFTDVAGQAAYYPDVSTYTDYTGTIQLNPTLTVGDFIPGQKYQIKTLGSTNISTWEDLGSTLTNDGEFIPGTEYIITSLGTTNWNSIGYIGIPTVGGIFTALNQGIGTGTGTALSTTFVAQFSGEYNSANFISGSQYTITNLGTTPWNTIGYVGTPVVGGIFTATESAVGTGTASQGTGTALSLTATTVTIPANDVVGTLQSGMYINDLIIDQENFLPPNTRILDISGTTTLSITIVCNSPFSILSTVNNVGFVASVKNNADLQLFDGARIVFAKDADNNIKNKIYIANLSIVDEPYPVITLTEAPNGLILENDQFVVLRGQNSQGSSYYFDGTDYVLAQQKLDVNVQPKFDVFDKNGISFSNQTIYDSSTFKGCDLFRYKRGTGTNDPILGFPISYSSINNVGDISFEVALNTDTFNYVSTINQNQPITENVNTGFVHNTVTKDTYDLLIGWQTAVAPSTQYQAFDFSYIPNAIPAVLEDGEYITYTVKCDINVLDRNITIWPNLLVYNNNDLLIENTDYTVTYNTNNTVVNVKLYSDTKTVIQVLILSEQISKVAYYTIPINLSNNPFNSDITTVDIGDIRGHYQSIFYNNPDSEGVLFGSNNTRDLGNLVPWGNRIIQNSASLVLPGAFLRNSNHNLFNALEYNSKEYIKFKTLLVDTVNKIACGQRFDASFILDDALEQISSVKNQDMPFFWSDMLPNKAPYIINVYNIQNTILESVYPLSQIYDYTKASYQGVLVYIETTADNIRVTRQLIRDVDYTVSNSSPSLTITKDLIKGDKVTIKEYNQTYGSYVPNTPTKLGLYPATIPSVVLDTSYVEPTYFIVGHDGSYNKLYGTYYPETNILVDYRDQTLLEFETRIYNNLKLSNTLPIDIADIVPGYFRTNKYSYDDWLQIYSVQFLNWVGQNRIDYKSQVYLSNNTYTYNYKNSGDRLSNQLVLQGCFRGMYEYYYDTSTPNQTPWEMIGYTNKPDWWETRYGPAPYTKNNLILWTDLQNGVDYNNGDVIVREKYVRPGLLNIIPVNEQGQLVDPFNCIVGNYNGNTLRRNWTVGDVGPAEFSYRRSSTYPFDLMRLYALMSPANFFNLGVDLDNYKYDNELNQYLYNGRSHLIPSDVEIYGNGTAKTSYINWIVDYEKQFGLGVTDVIKDLLKNLDVRLVYRLAGFSDKSLLKFFVEKGSPDSNNSSLLIPDESYQVLLYENQPYNRLSYSSVSVQVENTPTFKGYKVFGNGQLTTYFKTLKPILNGNYNKVRIQKLSVDVAKDYTDTIEYVPYGTIFYSPQDLAQFLMSYGKYLESEGMIFDTIESGIEINWQQMVAEYLYWAQVGWQTGSIITLNPAASNLHINKEDRIVQPLTLQQTNYILNQNLYPINVKDLCVNRTNNEFKVHVLNEGDTIAYVQFNLSNIEHGIVFDNITLFNDTIYNLITGLKQNRIYLRGTKSAEWNGTMTASGFIYNQDNITEYNKDVKYTKGSIIKYKNRYWTALTIIQPSNTFDEKKWKQTEYDKIQKGLLPNPSTRSFESALYYNVDKANLEQDADLLSFSLIGFRPRPYMVSADLTDITQVNVYKNMIKEKGTRNVLDAFKNTQLSQGGIDYDVYENWAILSNDFGGVLNSNFIEFKLNENKLTGNPSIVGLTNGNDIQGVDQLIPIYSLYNYGNPITNTEVLPTIPSENITSEFSDAGYVSVDDVKMTSYFYSDLPAAVDKNGLIVTLNELYVSDYVWLANYQSNWQILTPYSIGQIIQVRNNLNGTSTVQFDKPHNLNRYDIFAIINFNDAVNGYYVASQILNPYQLLIELNISTSNTQITGEGIGLKFNSARVSKPSDISNLPLLNNEFTQNKAWVDVNTNGSWAVYRKTINYKYNNTLTTNTTTRFGSAVSYTDQNNLIISDSDAGIVYRYQYDLLTKSYNLDQTINLGAGFGTAIATADNITFISKPTAYVAAYVVNDPTIDSDLANYQNNILAVMGSTNFGQALAASDDTNYLFISDFNEVTPAARNKVHVYRKNNIQTNAGSFVIGQSYQITEIGTTDFTLIGASENKVGVYFIATGIGSGTGKANKCDYELVYTINGPTATVDKFGYSLSTNYNGDMLVVGSPNADEGMIEDTGKTYVYQRLIQNFEVQFAGTNTSFALAWTPDNTKPLSVFINGTYLQATQYTLSGNIITIPQQLLAGDIVQIGGNEFVLIQTLTTEQTPRIGVRFGTSIDNNRYGNEVLVGAPFALSSENQEGAAYRYTYGSRRFGYITGTNTVNVTSPRTLLLNGYSVTIPIGNASIAATAINDAKITNIVASANNDILTISLVNQSIAQINQKLNIGATNNTALNELGLSLLTQTQVILCPHLTGPTQFGTVLKYDDDNSVVISAPVGTRYSYTTFDFTDDGNLDNDTVFDNNSTQFVETFANAGSVYMYDYLENYNETLDNIGNYVYAQSCNDTSLEYGSQPYYGTSLDFNGNKVIVGNPDFRPTDIDGQVVIYHNDTGLPNWSVYRQSNKIVDTSRIQNIQLFSAETNNTLVNLDYIDPLQGKLLGIARENIDIVSNTDPAAYNNALNTQSGYVWGSNKVGTIWLDTTNIRFVNYHQTDNTYNAKYWGAVFSGSDVAVYSWIASNVSPTEYQGPGLPKDITLYTVQTVINASNQITPVYFFWVRNTGVIYPNKTLADITISEYISDPQSSGISYFAALLPDAYALYNSQSYINANDTVLHIGYGTGTKDDIAHNEYALIRENFANDFLPGVPNIITGISNPESLYDRLLDSLSGTDEIGAVVPNPFLPKAVQSGVLARPRQSFFYNRNLALKNYIQYVNSVLSLYPITELRIPTFLNKTGTYYDVSNYWSYVNYWVPGYDDNTKASYQVPLYADLSTLSVPVKTIVNVLQNSQGFTETYIYEGDNVWNRIGLQNGTISFNEELYDYELGNFGYDGDFYDADGMDTYPSEETRWIIRAINEQIFINDLSTYRNKGLILLFEYIQTETDENQNYLTWLNKTSLIDVNHKVRELLPIQNYISDNQEFLSGYVNEVKPYHVVVKEFSFNYQGTDIFNGNMTDFDLPATYDTSNDVFVSPELVYTNPNTVYEFLPTDNVWTQDKYVNWYNNYGVSLTGQDDYLITRLTSYVTLGSDFILVDNASGFPTNGVIKIADIAVKNKFEYIGYNAVDTVLNKLSGLVRGLYETEIFDHIPNENVYIDLPPVVVLYGGKNYITTPNVIATIDTSIYPAPKTEAVLEAVMSLDKVVGVKVINPGLGYAVEPTIVIDPSTSYEFLSADVNTTTDSFEIYAPLLVTGDLVKYVASNNKVGGLIDDQYYYVHVLSTSPVTIVALYNTYSDSIKDTNRVKLHTPGTGTQTLTLGARAVPVVSSNPVRENNITLRFDRTTYTSQVIDWQPNLFYAGYSLGSLNNQENMNNEALLGLYPDINEILENNEGVAFPVESVSEVDGVAVVEVVYPGILHVTAIDGTNNAVTVPLSEIGTGGTLGLDTDTPVMFTGTVFGGVEENVIYYVDTILDIETFTIKSVDEPINLTTSTGNMTMEVQLPVSPGQVNGQQFTFYSTSNQYPNISTGVIGNLVTANIEQTVAISNIAIVNSTENMYANMRVNVGTNIGGLATGTDYYIIDIDDIEIGVTGTTSGNLVLTTDTTKIYQNMPITFTGTSIGNVLINQPYYVGSIVSNTSFKLSLLPNWPAATEVALSNSTGLLVGVGPEYIQVSTTLMGSAVSLSTATGTSTVTQSVISNPVFDASYVLGGYRVVVSSLGQGMAVDNTITIPGNLIGGATTENDLVITVTDIDSQGGVIDTLSAGVPNDTENKYYLKVLSANTFAVYNDPKFMQPVSQSELIYVGFTTTTVTDVTASDDRITVGSSSDFNVDDLVVFTGNIFTSELTLGQTYYIYDKPTSTTVRLTTTPGGPVLNFAINANGNMTMAKPGSFALLPEPFYFDQSIVKFNNRVYACVVSNNDDTFVFGKYELLDSGDYRLNAMDRATGYYSPTYDMPGNELEQLFTGVTYPNTTYLGNEFELINQFPIDTNLLDQDFPTNIDLVAILFRTQNYVTAVNLAGYSGFAADIEVANSWLVAKISDQPLALSDMIYEDNLYVVTSTNSPTPLMISRDNGNTFSTSGYFVPYNTPTADIEYIKTRLIASNLQLSSVTYGLGKYVAVGSTIITTDDTELWYETYQFTGTGTFYDVRFVNNNFFTGFIAVGVNNSSKIIVYSTDGIVWTQATIFDYGAASISEQNATLRSIAFSPTNIILVGDLGVVYKSENVSEWTLVDVVDNNLNAVEYANNVFVAAGDNGFICKSTDGINYEEVNSITSEKLNAINYRSTTNTWTIVGDNDTIVQTTNITALIVNWNTQRIFYLPTPEYTVQGDPFQAGYAPEEMVAGLVTDQLTMIVTSEPNTSGSGPNWPLPLPTVDELVYIQQVSQNGVGSVYRVLANTTTTLTENVNKLDNIISVQDTDDVTIVNIQLDVAPAIVGNYYTIVLNANRQDIVFISIENTTKSLTIPPQFVSVEVDGEDAYAVITPGSAYIQAGDNLVITTIEAGIIYVDGEYMRITNVDQTNNKLTVMRGVEAGFVRSFIPANSTVYSFFDANLMGQPLYNDTWNKIPGTYEVLTGDPLQAADYDGARFLRGEI
jgi:hypothetical protein